MENNQLTLTASQPSLIFFYIDGELEKINKESWDKDSPRLRLSTSPTIPKLLIDQLLHLMTKEQIIASKRVENWKQRYSRDFSSWDKEDVFQGFILVYM